ncbi:RNA-directed DNA polymerase [Lactobacillus sp. ESL0791]|uniref:RNA-directed DNA polymerase n=1 Tax=Lactobacillus sp. ESL0791 TaxID=2983234 RepID=UPI0023F6FBFD|nr:RNA-directed DNA polymerase [Lactobacillus sp. ESL0791]MDF7638430.1 RNA-directed DNA polymerase [Lactobacillus sp. ESL0791]
MVKRTKEEILYDKIFTPKFLVKFGYYDVKSKKDKNNEKRIYESNYVKSDVILPDIFNMDEVSLLLDEKFKRRFFENVPKSTWTEPISFTIPKTVFSRREYKMINIFSYIELVYFVCENKSKFIDKFLEDTHSTSKYFGELFFSFSKTDQIKEMQLNDGDKRLHSDLSNFYPSLYTHTIPWIISGRDESKKDTSKGFSNNLDRLIRNSQYGETHGIPTGNLISTIIAELYMCYFDDELDSTLSNSSKYKGEIKYNRYVDDILYSYFDDNQKNEFLNAFRYNCSKYDLIINDKKTYIEEFPFSHDLDKTNIFNYLNKFKDTEKFYKKIKLISDFIDMCEKEENHGNKGAIKCLFSVLSNVLVKTYKSNSKDINKVFTYFDDITNFNVYIKLMKISMQYSTMSNKFVFLTKEMINLGVNRDELKHIVSKFFLKNSKDYREKLEVFFNNSYNQEIYQIMLYFVIFDVDTREYLSEKDLLNFMNEKLDDYTLCLALILYIKSNYRLEKMLKVINDMFLSVTKHYDINKTDFMAQKLWLFKYFFYDLVKNDVISEQLIGNVLKPNLDYKYGYITVLNYKYVLHLGKKGNVNRFFLECLNKNIHFVSFGINNKFSYL